MIAAALLTALSALPACSGELGVWQALGEPSLHTKYFAVREGPVADVLAACDAEGRLRLPAAYARDYALTARDKGTLERMLAAAKGYAFIGTALKDGYLPVRGGFAPGQGLRLVKAELLLDGAFRIDKPDMLSYVKTKNQPEFRLLGLIYAAGERPPGDVPPMDFEEETRRENPVGKAEISTWDWEDDWCVVVKPGDSVAIHDRSTTPNRCRGGKAFKRLFLLHAWPLVYNPDGLFVSRNPTVDYLDHAQNFGPVCAPAKPAAPAPRRRLKL